LLSLLRLPPEIDTQKLTSNLKMVCKRTGLPQEIWYHSFRCQFDTHVERALDITTAQTAIDHGIGSSEYYSHHDRGLCHLGLTDLIVSYGFVVPPL
jgi:hypothetical protein